MRSIIDKAKAKQYYLDHPELKEKSRLYYQNKIKNASLEDKEIARKKRREYYKKYKAAHPEKCKQYAEKWNSSAGCKKAKEKWLASDKGKKFVENKKKVSCIIYNTKLYYGCMNPNCTSSKIVETCCLDFHHINPNNKLFHLSNGGSFPLDKVCNEMRKCTILCANCHRLTSYDKLDTSDFKTCLIDDSGNIQQD